MVFGRAWWAPIGAVLLTLGCDRSNPSGVGPAAPLRVAAASDLQAALPALAARFEATQRVPVTLTFGASGQLADQIRGGAPFDVFLSADRRIIEELGVEALVRPKTIAPYARGSLVLAVHAASGVAVEGLADLATPGVKKVAIANPATAPYGAAARQALQRAGLWEGLVRDHKIVQAESVRQALQYVQTGNAEVGLVGRAIARVPEVRVVDVDPALYDPIVQALGIVTNSRREEAAWEFWRFVLGGEGQAILAEYGFARVGPPTPSHPGPPPQTGRE